jgi:hypothetical protein
MRLGVPIKGKGFSNENTVEGIEIFPKQDSLKPGELGNALRGPLGIHRKDGKRYWFDGGGSPLPQTLEAQMNFLIKTPKMTAQQLDQLIFGLPIPAQLAEPAPETFKRSSVPSQGGKQDWIYGYVSFLRKRCIGGNYFVQCPSCARIGGDTHGNNLAVAKPRGPKHGFYQCWAGCDSKMIQNAFGYLSRSRFNK